MHKPGDFVVDETQNVYNVYKVLDVHCVLCQHASLKGLAGCPEGAPYIRVQRLGKTYMIVCHKTESLRPATPSEILEVLL